MQTVWREAKGICVFLFAAWIILGGGISVMSRVLGALPSTAGTIATGASRAFDSSQLQPGNVSTNQIRVPDIASSGRVSLSVDGKPLVTATAMPLATPAVIALGTSGMGNASLDQRQGAQIIPRGVPDNARQPEPTPLAKWEPTIILETDEYTFVDRGPDSEARYCVQLISKGIEICDRDDSMKFPSTQEFLARSMKAGLMKGQPIASS